ncbi:hypothetical protein NKH18_22115 [Streptomyces sp. M10(2022)]
MSTVLFHNGRSVGSILNGHTSHWDEFYDQEVVLVLDDDGFLRSRALDGAVLEQIAGRAPSSSSCAAGRSSVTTREPSYGRPPVTSCRTRCGSRPCH